jgi:hypothetical protein
MQQALTEESSLRQSMQHRGGIIIQAQINGQDTTYRFCPVSKHNFLSA